jgi:(1->4)-alpha-D-glucan 1-alpha-D-glucosylmutase
MIVPRATYRLQLRHGMTFGRAAQLAPYWQRLGISHLYASPIFSAVSGSPHGYDVTDPTALDAALGGEPEFHAMCAALKAAGLGLIVDFVPNHMAASVESPWWRDVLRHGRKSNFAGHFDIDWTRGPLTLPFLSDSFEATVRAGKLTLIREGTSHVLRYVATDYPLSAEGNALIDHATRAGATLGALICDAEFMSRLHAVQHWRLLDWRVGAQNLTYRRFFDIASLVGLRVEDHAVFADVHGKLFELIDEELIDGLRLDHIDGLADPTAYLKRLRARVGHDVFIVVEKILERDEALRSDWPVQGTTGYEFIAALGAILTSSKNATTLDRDYRAVTGDEAPYEAQIAQAKREVVERSLTAERITLTALARDACLAAWPDPEWTEAALSPAVTAMMAGLPVYRAYIDTDGASAADRSLIAEATRQEAAADPAHLAAIEAIGKLLALDVSIAARPAAIAFVTRFQQTTGAVMAKGVEDTAFYRFNRLIALNEVGGDPDRIGGRRQEWHEAMAERRARTPRALNATATHDTKRGEDARARLYAISEAPEHWRALTERWNTLLPAPALDDGTRWMLFQALFGVWPALLHPDITVLESLARRFSSYAVKAAREAKRFTSWTDPDQTYESRVRDFAEALFASENAAFRADFESSIDPFLRTGAINSLAQTLLKLTAPGVPDVYQGTEDWDLSLVDPDNRRLVNFAELIAVGGREASATPRQIMADWRNAAPKRHLLKQALAARRREPALFSDGSYAPVPVAGPAAAHIVAFARMHASGCAVVVVPRLVFRHVTLEGPLALEPGWLASTVIDLRGLHAGELRNRLTGKPVKGDRIAAAALWREMPVALLLAR